MSWRLRLMSMLLLVGVLALAPRFAASVAATDLTPISIEEPEINGIVPSRLKMHQTLELKFQQVELLDPRCSSVARKMQTPCAEIPIDVLDYTPPDHNTSPPSKAPGAP